jgi:DNA polymerase III sliding clamp (beta) subunit (PCNA family)
MPFISFDQKKLSKILGVCSQISNPKNPVELYTYTRVAIRSENMVEVCAVNEQVTFKTALRSINLEQLEPDTAFLIKTDLFYSAVNLISDDIVGLDINLKTQTLVVQGARSKHTLRIDVAKAAEFREAQVDESKNEVLVHITGAQLQHANKIAQVSVGNPRTVYQSEFLSVCFTLLKAENKLIMASTDRFRVTRLTPDATVVEFYDSFENTSKNYLVPPRSVGMLEYFDAAKIVDLVFNSEYLVARSDEGQFVIRYGEGIFPDYNKIIPQSFVCSFSIATKEVADALKQVLFSARINNDTHSVKIKVNPENNKVIFAAETKDGYASESVVDLMSYEGDTTPWEQSFNIDYLVNHLNTIEESHILWEANPGKPSVLSPHNKKEVQLYLVSGLR